MTSGAHANERHKDLEHLLYEVKKIVVGQDHFLERVLVALLAGGHLLVEGLPGLAKTLTVSTLARAMRGSEGAGSVSLKPWPGRSGAITRKSRARCGSSPRQDVGVQAKTPVGLEVGFAQFAHQCAALITRE